MCFFPPVLLVVGHLRDRVPVSERACFARSPDECGTATWSVRVYGIGDEAVTLPVFQSGWKWPGMPSQLSPSSPQLHSCDPILISETAWEQTLSVFRSQCF